MPLRPRPASLGGVPAQKREGSGGARLSASPLLQEKSCSLAEPSGSFSSPLPTAYPPVSYTPLHFSQFSTWVIPLPASTPLTTQLLLFQLTPTFLQRQFKSPLEQPACTYALT